jgi:hypothetical protein
VRPQRQFVVSLDYRFGHRTEKCETEKYATPFLSYFSVSHFSVRLVSIAEATIKAL